eukprot:CAMPEP_0194046944 /NCGR_PEP_ID=MMETSP0009_2-20130614/23060_1 /TAXON_ID=210454 /ORGANISM="Grammatophora oceanica, Strain CCMP 410" /LENGTH=113 /DNA_ID=CAMNT_0038692421 /DNA_START=122 /DNA_END=463 /DNA_ORIENTATION=-
MFSSFKKSSSPSTTKPFTMDGGANNSKLVRRGTEETADMTEDDFSFSVSPSVVQEDSEVSWILNQMKTSAAKVVQPPKYNFPAYNPATNNAKPTMLSDDAEVKFIMGGMLGRR